MGKAYLPESLRRFVARQATRPVADLWDGAREEGHSPYGSYWYRAVAGILLSGRVQAENDGAPNMTDVNRVGKEANFNSTSPSGSGSSSSRRTRSDSTARTGMGRGRTSMRSGIT